MQSQKWAMKSQTWAPESQAWASAWLVRTISREASLCCKSQAWARSSCALLQGCGHGHEGLLGKCGFRADQGE